MSPDQPIDGSIADRVVTVLTPLLGPHTARRALAMICKRAGKDAEALGPDDLPVAHSLLRPMLRTLIGNDVTVRVLADIGLPPGASPTIPPTIPPTEELP